MTTSVLHVTDAASSGVLAAVTTLARAQSARAGAEITLAYVPRHDSPSRDRIQAMTGPEVRVVPWARSPRTAMPALLARTLTRFAGGRDDIIHLHSSRTGMLGRLAALLTGRRGRTVYSPHCFAFDRSDATARTRGVLTGLERLGTAMAPRLLLVSEAEEELARRVLPGARTAVLRNRVDASALATVADRARGDRGAGAATGLRIAHVGRIAPQKRPGEFAALARRWRRGEQRATGTASTTFRWLGEGDRSLLADADGDVEVSGWLDREALHVELARADLLLFTSAGEGMPIAVLEAQAMGVPVIAHDVTGLADVVRDGGTGVLAADGAGLFRALGELAADAPRRRAMGEAAHRRVREHFDLAPLAADSFAAYRRLGIESAPGGAPSAVASPRRSPARSGDRRMA